jgi:hypothetical protein
MHFGPGQDREWRFIRIRGFPERHLRLCFARQWATLLQFLLKNKRKKKAETKSSIPGSPSTKVGGLIVGLLPLTKAELIPGSMFPSITSAHRHVVPTSNHLYKQFFLNHTVQRRRSQHARTLTPMNTRTQTLPLWAPSKDWAPADPEIPEVIISASSLTGTSITT